MNQAMHMTRMTQVAFTVLIFAVASLAAGIPARAQAQAQSKTEAKAAPKTPAPAKKTTAAQAQMLTANAPLVFEPNVGQAPANVQWLARGSRFIIGITSDGAVMEFRDEGNPPLPGHSLRTFATPPPGNAGGFTRPVAPKSEKSSLVKMQLSGSGTWKGEGVSPTGGISNYFIGNTPANWHTKIPHYAQVKASGVYKGIDVVFHGDRGSLEYDFVVAPNADPKQIGLKFEGGSGLRMDKGDLVLTTPGGNELRHVQPKIQQEIGGKKTNVTGGFEISKDGTVGFTLGSYDSKYPLVIDPTITFVRFLAGSDLDEATAVAADPVLNSYVTGYTYSANFPVLGEGNVGQSGPVNAFFTKLSPNGTILSSTYLGGSTFDIGSGIAVDASGVYLTGQTQSSDFPHYPWDPGLNGSSDAFFTKFSLLGDTIFYTRYLGGSDWDGGFAIAVDSDRSAYIAGQTYSSDFPTTIGAFETHAGNPSAGHVFVTKTSPSGALLTYSTYLASDSADIGQAIAVDSSFSAIVSGVTCSFTFPFAGFFSQSFPSDCSAFATKMSPAGDSLIYSTSLGTQTYWGNGVALDSGGNAYITGNGYTGLGTSSVAAQAYVTKLSPVGASLYFRQLVGTNGSSVGNAITTDAYGNTWVGGSTSSTTFPGAPTVKPNPTAGFLVKLDNKGDGPIYTILLGAAVNGVAVIELRPRIIVEPTYPSIFTAGIRFTGGTAQSDQDAFVVRVDEGGTVVINQ
jgi:Beta-propeller repeat